MARRSKPHEETKAAARVLSPDDRWADELRERVLRDCHPYQRAAVDTTRRFITLLIGRGGGKTTTKRARALIKLTRIRRGRILYLAPTRGMAEELQWEPLKSAIEFYGLANDFTFNNSDLRATCKRTGAFYKLVGMDDQAEVDKQRGQPWDEVQPDEASLYKAKILLNFLERAIGPRLGERNGTICMGGTPGHILSGPFYDYTRPGSGLHRTLEQLRQPDPEDAPDDHIPNAKWDSYVSFAWTLKDVADLPEAPDRYVALVNLWREALAEKERKRWSDSHPVWLREYLGQWASDDTDMVYRYRPFADDGAPWNQWDPYGNRKLEGLLGLQVALAALKREHAKLREWRFVIAADKGSTDPFALNIFAFSPADKDRRIWHVMPFERTGMYIKQWAEMLLGPELNATSPRGLLGEIGWPDGAVMDSDQTTIDELARVYGIRFAKADRNPHSKAGAIELVNGDLVDGRIKIIKGSHLETQLQTLQWAENSHGQLIENKAQANHSVDTLCYSRKTIASLWQSGVVSDDSGKDTKATASTFTDPMGLDGGTDAGDNSGGDMMAPSDFGEAW